MSGGTGLGGWAGLAAWSPESSWGLEAGWYGGKCAWLRFEFLSATLQLCGFQKPLLPCEPQFPRLLAGGHSSSTCFRDLLNTPELSLGNGGVSSPSLLGCSKVDFSF